MALKTIEDNDNMDFLKGKIFKKQTNEECLYKKRLAKGLGEATGVY